MRCYFGFGFGFLFSFVSLVGDSEFQDVVVKCTHERVPR